MPPLPAKMRELPRGMWVFWVDCAMERCAVVNRYRATVVEGRCAAAYGCVAVIDGKSVAGGDGGVGGMPCQVQARPQTAPRRPPPRWPERFLLPAAIGFSRGTSQRKGSFGFKNSGMKTRFSITYVQTLVFRRHVERTEQFLRAKRPTHLSNPGLLLDEQVAELTILSVSPDRGDKTTPQSE